MSRAIQQLSPGYPAFLQGRFWMVGGEVAAPELRGTYAKVRRPGGALGLVAVGADGSVWYKAGADEQTDLVALGFAYSEHNLLAALYFHLPFESCHRRPLPAPFPWLAPVLPMGQPSPAAPSQTTAVGALVA